MSTPFLAEVKIVGFGFAPKGWALCNGQLLPINQNQALFSLLGTTFGGDGRVNFALPDLRARSAIHTDTNFPMGTQLGEEAHTLSAAEMPVHDHALMASRDFANATAPAGNVLGAKAGRFGKDIYANAANLTPLQSGSVGSVGGQPHNNMQPFLTLNFVIALQGIFPSRN